FTAALLEAEYGRREVQFVVHDEDLPGPDTVELRERGHGTAGDVHVGEWLGEHDAGAGHSPGPESQAALEDLGTRLAVAAEGAGDLVGQRVEDMLADVVTVARVGGPGVAQAHHEENRHGVRIRPLRRPLRPARPRPRPRSLPRPLPARCTAR